MGLCQDLPEASLPVEPSLFQQDHVIRKPGQAVNLVRDKNDGLIRDLF